MWISPALHAAAAAHPRLRIVGAQPLAFTAAGALAAPWQLED
jgi:hypothetical protein